MQVGKINNKTINFPQLRGSLAGVRYPALAELKYDGEFNYIIFKNSDTYTINKYGTMRRDFPHLNLVKKKLESNSVSSAVLVCEVYWNEGKLGALYDLLSKKKDDAIKLCIFDVIELNNDNVRNHTLLDRKELLHDVGLKRWLPKCWVVEDKADVDIRFQGATLEGYEGIVVKDFDTHFVNGPCSWVKIKYKDRSDYQVSLVEHIKERIEVQVPVTKPNQPQWITLGVKAPNRYKAHIKVGDMVTVEHQGVLASGSLRHPVLIAKKEWK